MLRQTSDFIAWLVPCAGNRNQILPCNWLPERARWSNLARSGLPAVYREKYFPESQISPLFIKPSRSRWLDIGLVLFCEFMDPTSSRSINTQKKNLVHIFWSTSFPGLFPWLTFWSVISFYTIIKLVRAL